MSSLRAILARPATPAVALLIAVAVICSVRAVRFKFDFHHFYLDAEYVWQHGALNPDLDNKDREQRRRLPFYLPVVPLALAPLTAFGRIPAAVLWTIAQVAALGYCLRVLARWAGGPAARRACVLACIVALPAIYEAARFNQVGFFVLALVLAASVALERQRGFRAGALLGLAGALKLLPLVLLVWLALTRRWSAAVALLVTAAAVATVPCLVVFGPSATIRYHQQWWQYNVRGAPARGMTDPGLTHHFLDHRNQSLPAVFARVCWPEHPYRAPVQLADLDPTTCRRVAYLALGGLAVALFWMTSRPMRRGQHISSADGSETSIGRDRAEISAYLVALLVLSPLLRTYYLIWMLPALVLLASACTDATTRAARRAGRIGVLVWLLGMAGWVFPVLRTYGLHFWMSLVIAAMVLALPRIVNRTSEAPRPQRLADPGQTPMR